MKHRMKTYLLSKEQLKDLLSRVQTGSLAMFNPDGTPYGVQVYFVFINDCIYMHGLPKGQKIDNIIHDSKIGFAAYEMQNLLLDTNGNPCDTNTKYESVIVIGNASLVEDMAERKTVLQKFVKKYAPYLAEMPFSNSMVRDTIIIRINIAELTGKYYEQV